MFVKKIHIHKFRGFEDIEIELGNKVTIIAGQNGTQKTTLLGMIAQTFSLRDKSNPLSEERTLDGYRFEMKLNDMFKFSTVFDLPKSHRWDLHVSEDIYQDALYPIESSMRSDTQTLRFWKLGDRSKGSGYIQLPVLYLSLKRLFPIGELTKLNHKTQLETPLTNEEKEWFADQYRQILALNDSVENVQLINETNKGTLVPLTNFNDGVTSSAGQDNIGKILLAVLSFKRLQLQYPDVYKGGLLLIDELDATLFPVAQEKLFEKLFRFSSDLQLQIFFTTHSLDIIKGALTGKYKRHTQLIYLSKQGGKIAVAENPTIKQIENDLHMLATGNPIKPKKLKIYTEDDEAKIFIKGLLGNKYTKLIDFVNASIGSESLVELVRIKIPEFQSSLIILDGDVSESKIKNYRNCVLLPGSGKSPEKLFYDYLQNLPDDDEFWSKELGEYNKGVCFRDKNYTDGLPNRVVAKEWFNEQKQHWGRGCTRLINHWRKNNLEITDKFVNDFIKAYNYVAKKNGFEQIN